MEVMAAIGVYRKGVVDQLGVFGVHKAQQCKTFGAVRTQTGHPWYKQ